MFAFDLNILSIYSRNINQYTLAISQYILAIFAERPNTKKCKCIIPRKSANGHSTKSASFQAVKSNGNLDWVVPRKSANDECPFREKVQG